MWNCRVSHLRLACRGGGGDGGVFISARPVGRLSGGWRCRRGVLAGPVSSGGGGGGGVAQCPPTAPGDSLVCVELHSPPDNAGGVQQSAQISPGREMTNRSVRPKPPIIIIR